MSSVISKMLTRYAIFISFPFFKDKYSLFQSGKIFCIVKEVENTTAQTILGPRFLVLCYAETKPHWLGKTFAQQLGRHYKNLQCINTIVPIQVRNVWHILQVLRCMGPIALKNLIENADLYYKSVADQKKKDI